MDETLTVRLALLVVLLISKNLGVVGVYMLFFGGGGVSIRRVLGFL